MANLRIRINQLPVDGAPSTSDLVPIDNGTTRATTVADMADAARPYATEQQAETGADNATTMTPLRTAQAIAALGAAQFASSAQGAAADTAVQPGSLATVATSGSYDDLGDKPMIPASQVNADWGATGGVEEILNKPNFAAVALSGDYDDLANAPTLGDAAARNVGTTAGTVAAGDDSRITGAMQASVYDPQAIADDAFDRANHTGTQGADTITGLGGAALLSVGTTSGTVAAGDDSRITGAMQASVYDPDGIEADAFDRANHTGTQAADTIAGSTALGRSLLAATDQANARWLINAGPGLARATTTEADEGTQASTDRNWTPALVRRAADAAIDARNFGDLAELNLPGVAQGYVLDDAGAWVPLSGGGSVTSVGLSVPTGLSVAGSPVTSSGTLAISYAAGYVGFTTAMSSKLGGIEAGADVTDATNVAAAGAVMDADFGTNGLMARTAAGAYASRTLSAGAGISVSNGNGASGNPSVALSAGAQSSLGLADSALQPGAIGVTVQGYDAATAKLDIEDQALTGGARVTSKSLGTISSGTATPDPGDRPLQHYTNNGAHTLAPGGNAGSYLLDITNGASAGAITTSGWTKVAGDSFTTVNADKFRCHCSVGNGGSLLIVQALQ